MPAVALVGGGAGHLLGVLRGDLDGDVARHERVEALVDHAAGAAADLALDLVLADALGRVGRSPRDLLRLGRRRAAGSEVVAGLVHDC